MRLFLTFCLGIFLLGIAFFAWTCLYEGQVQAKEPYWVITQGEKGYGYQIFIGEHELIRQETIPVLKGLNGFSTKEEAEKVAQLMLIKLQERAMPTVTLSELEQLGIPIKANN